MSYEKSAELALLESLYSATGETRPPSQRKLAEASGLSLGMTNALLKRFVERGWVKLSHISGRSLKYALTPNGMEEISRRAVDYFVRASRNASLYRDRIDEFAKALKASGYAALALQGPAELDFLFDYACEIHGVRFYKQLCPEEAEKLAGAAKTMFVTMDDAGHHEIPSSASRLGFSTILSRVYE